MPGAALFFFLVVINDLTLDDVALVFQTFIALDIGKNNSNQTKDDFIDKRNEIRDKKIKNEQECRNQEQVLEL